MRLRSARETDPMRNRRAKQRYKNYGVFSKA
jgi:hypothetical protein